MACVRLGSRSQLRVAALPSMTIGGNLDTCAHVAKSAALTGMHAPSRDLVVDLGVGSGGEALFTHLGRRLYSQPVLCVLLRGSAGPRWMLDSYGSCWGPGGGGGVRHARGGIFHATVRPKEKITLRAVRAEAKLRRHGIARYNKRWRSWAQQRVRQFQLPLPVTLTSDTALMGPAYVTSCVQKAAALRKHDLQLWHGFSDRILELRHEMQPEQLGYILWGYGKSRFISEHFYRELMPTIKEQLPHFQSHALMSTMWCLKNVKWRDRELLRAVAQTTLDRVDSLRPSDFIKVSNALAALGLADPALRDAMSSVAVAKFEETFAQQFRDAVNPVTIGCFWDENVTAYLLERFRRIFITARPNHLLKAYEAAVVCRVHMPQVWRSLSRDARQFYVRLSQRHISDKSWEPTPFQWDVSRHLADIGEVHRNAFRWGPFTVDIGLEELELDERRRCIMVDAPGSFFFGSDQYLPRRKLHHQMLSSLGWDIRRVRWDDWGQLQIGEKQAFLQSLLDQNAPVGEILLDRPPAPAGEVKQRMRMLHESMLQVEGAERAAKEDSKMDFDI